MRWAIGAAGCGCLLLLVPICAAIAIPAFINYTKRSKASEATAELRSLAAAVQLQCQSGEDLSGLRAGPLPLAPGSIQNIPVWQADPGFARIGWQANGPVRYSYQIEPAAHDPAQLTLKAQGDLDDDGDLSTYSLSCDLRGCACTTVVQMDNELE